MSRTLTETEARLLADRHGLPWEPVRALLREAGVVVVPDIAGREQRVGDTIPAEALHAHDLVGEAQADGQVWVAKSPIGKRRRFVSRDEWYRMAELVAQGGGTGYLQEGSG